MPSVEVCVDMPDLGEGRRFYQAAFGLLEESSPVSNVVVLAADNVRICLLHRAEGSRASTTADGTRSFGRHWTPVHLDFRVTDIRAALQRALEAGAVAESEIQTDEHGSWVTCADPFGNGFCFIQPK